MIEFSRKLSKPEQLIVQKTIQRNGFYAHPENVLLSMLADEDAMVRERAVDKILALRPKNKGTGKKGKVEAEGKKRREEEAAGEDQEGKVKEGKAKKAGEGMDEKQQIQTKNNIEC